MNRLPLLSLALMIGCGPAVTEVATPRGDRLAPSTLYPMLEGSQWVYDVDTGGGEPPTLGIFEVTASAGERRSIANVRGMSADGQVTYGEPIEYEVTREGIRHVASGGWVLRAPIREGATWPGMGGRTARVTDDDVSVEVVAGTYEHCVEVEETGGDDGRAIRTVYCPDVGPVDVESQMRTELTMRTVGTRSGLRSYDSGAGDEL